MDHILESKQFSCNEIRALNYCRMYLGALTIADLATSTGDRLDNAKLQGDSSLRSIETKWIKVPQDCPSNPEWKLWRRANELWSDQDGILKIPWGEWKRNHQKSRLEHFAYATSDCLYVRRHHRKEYSVCRKLHAQEYAQQQRTIRPLSIPKNAVPFEIEAVGRDRWRVNRRTNNPPVERQPAITTFSAYIYSLEAWEVDLLERTDLLADAFTICLELQEEFVAGSDGSKMFNTNGAFGWESSNRVGERAAQGMGPLSGSIMDSYRAECSGMLSILRFLLRLAELTFMEGTWTGTTRTDS